MPAKTVPSIKSLTKSLTSCGITVRRTSRLLELFSHPQKTSFRDALPHLYRILNSYEKQYFIVIHGWPFCLLPDAADHIYPVKHKARGCVCPESCRPCRFNHLCAGWPSSLAPLNPAPQADLPKEIVIEVTKDCNLRCRQCLKIKEPLSLSLSEAKAVVDQAWRAGVKTVRITGGEPLLYPHLKNLLSYIKSRGLACFLNTNLTLLNDSMKEWLPLFVDNLLVSFQGYNPKTEARLTGPFSNFTEKMKNLLWARKTIPVVRTGSVLSRTLLNHYHAYKKWMDLLQPDCWELYRPMSEISEPEFQWEKKDYRRLLKKIKKDASSYPVKFANAVPFCGLASCWGDLRFFIGARADDGHSRLVFDTSGFFKPSYFMEKNLGKELLKAWNHPWMKQIRSLCYMSGGDCRACRAHSWCMGGSRFWAQKTNQSFLAKDPLADSPKAFRTLP